MGKEINKTLFGAKSLTTEEAEAKRDEHGENILTPPARTPLWRLYLEKYHDPIIRILIIAACISLFIAVIENDYIETIGIIIAIFLATTIGFVFEVDASRKFALLTKINEDTPVKVIRDGRVKLIPRKNIVVGDIVILDVGDEIPADGELIESTDLEIDESSLTGEPMVTKHADPQNNDTEATYSSSSVLRSTLVMNGNGRMIVRKTGDDTEIGKVARKSTEETKIITPLNKQLNRLASLINKIGFGIAIAAFVVFLAHDIIVDPHNIWSSGEYLQMANEVLKYFMMAVTLIVMAVPEGLPMAVTLSLALNMRRMLKNNILVRNLHACETMGAVTVICTDKTGTLTENKMQVADFVFEDISGCDDKEKLLAYAIALNSTADIGDDGKAIGNPTEGALLLWMKNKGYDYIKIRREAELINRVPFSTERKYMSTEVRIGGRDYTFLKGAPEIVMDMCDLQPGRRKELHDLLSGYQKEAKRTLALACDDHLQGIVAISDPVRADVPDAVSQCRDAGIDVKIVTGDTKATAVEIARQIGIWDDNTPDECEITGTDFEALSDEEAYERVAKLRVMSRARPTDKQRMVQLLQKRGEVVAVTGDGTNDAPALHYAHVGLSLGTGTSVAKTASDITIIDDSFQSIVKAVMWGRSLYRNIQRFLFFQLIVNVTALLLVFIGAFVGTELPLTVTQILWVNLIMDTFAAMALASLPPSREVMKDKPRNQNDFIITPSMSKGILLTGVLFFAVVFSLLVHCERIAGVSPEELTLLFTVFVLLQWWNLINAKFLFSSRTCFKHFFWGRGFVTIFALILVGQILIVTFGGEMFRVVPMSAEWWIKCIVYTSPVMFIGEVYRLYKRHIKHS